MRKSSDRSGRSSQKFDKRAKRATKDYNDKQSVKYKSWKNDEQG